MYASWFSVQKYFKCHESHYICRFHSTRKLLYIYNSDCAMKPNVFWKVLCFHFRNLQGLSIGRLLFFYKACQNWNAFWCFSVSIKIKFVWFFENRFHGHKLLWKFVKNHWNPWFGVCRYIWFKYVHKYSRGISLMYNVFDLLILFTCYVPKGITFLRFPM